MEAKKQKLNDGASIPVKVKSEEQSPPGSEERHKVHSATSSQANHSIPPLDATFPFPFMPNPFLNDAYQLPVLPNNSFAFPHLSTVPATSQSTRFDQLEQAKQDLMNQVQKLTFEQEALKQAENGAMQNTELKEENRFLLHQVQFFTTNYSTLKKKYEHARNSAVELANQNQRLQNELSTSPLHQELRQLKDKVAEQKKQVTTKDSALRQRNTTINQLKTQLQAQTVNSNNGDFASLQKMHEAALNQIQEYRQQVIQLEERALKAEKKAGEREALNNALTSHCFLVKSRLQSLVGESSNVVGSQPAAQVKYEKVDVGNSSISHQNKKHDLVNPNGGRLVNVLDEYVSLIQPKSPFGVKRPAKSILDVSQAMQSDSVIGSGASLNYSLNSASKGRQDYGNQ